MRPPLRTVTSFVYLLDLLTRKSAALSSATRFYDTILDHTILRAFAPSLRRTMGNRNFLMRTECLLTLCSGCILKKNIPPGGDQIHQRLKSDAVKMLYIYDEV